MKLIHLIEANLSGRSRSGGGSNWDTYVVKNFNKDTQFTIEGGGSIVDLSGKEIGTLKSGDLIQILSPNLTQVGRSNLAKVLLLRTNLEGFVNISLIQKPTTKSKNSVIPGGKNSKEFTPDKLGLTGTKFSSASSMASFVSRKLKSLYGDDIYRGVRMYLYDCISATTGNVITEAFSKTYSIKNTENVSTEDIGILSKNFGEVLGAMYILTTNKKAKYVEFPSDISQGLYDFIVVRNDGLTNYYSVKSLGGSSTSMENINYVLKHFSDTNETLQKYKKEVSVIQNLMNNKKEGITTIKNIENFFKNVLSGKNSDIIRELNKISSYKLNSLSQTELDNWFKSMISSGTSVELFISTLNNIYTNILGDIGSTPKATPRVLEEIYSSGNGSQFNHGYVIYPMGSYIVNYLNNVGEYKTVLNILLNYGSFIYQLDVDMNPKGVQIQIASFKTKSFKFSYNAGTKYPGNRPIGFIKQ